MSVVLERLAAKDPRIEDYSNETDTEDGHWLYLVPGLFCPDTDCHYVHEWTVQATLRSFRSILRCYCDDCLLAIQRNALRVIMEMMGATK